MVELIYKQTLIAFKTYSVSTEYVDNQCVLFRFPQNFFDLFVFLLTAFFWRVIYLKNIIVSDSKLLLENSSHIQWIFLSFSNVLEYLMKLGFFALVYVIYKNRRVVKSGQVLQLNWNMNLLAGNRNILVSESWGDFWWFSTYIIQWFDLLLWNHSQVCSWILWVSDPIRCKLSTSCSSDRLSFGK